MSFPKKNMMSHLRRCNLIGAEVSCYSSWHELKKLYGCVQWGGKGVDHLTYLLLILFFDTHGLEGWPFLHVPKMEQN